MFDLSHHLSRILLAAFTFQCIGILATANAQGVPPGYRVERIASGLDLPVFVTQAPGDPNSIYVVEEQTNDFNDNGSSGQIVKVDLTTGQQSSFLRIEDIFRPLEGGLHSLAFHPDFETNGKFYVSWIKNPLPGGNQPQVRLDEFTVGSNNVPALTNTLLDITNLRSAAHSINYIGFKPGATGDERNQLYVATGDGGTQANELGFTAESQDLSSVRGKILRIDVAAPDAYPNDDTRNYGFPSDNPFASDGDDNTLGEILHSGLRNPFQVSFDAPTGDLYIGDVGFNSREEINFAREDQAGLDFGWSSREGTIQTPVQGIGGPQGDSINPILELNHNSDVDSEGNFIAPVGSITGGVVYRGPVEEFRGQYFFAEALAGEVFAGTFDRNTPSDDFDGENIDDFVIVTDQLNAAIDPGEERIDLVTSFGQDAEGNLLIVDFANPGNLFGDPFNDGEVFRLVALIPEPTSFVIIGIFTSLFAIQRKRKL